MSFLINPYAFLAAGGDFESIATVTVGSGGASSIEFTSIPGTYQHLQVRMIARTTRSDTRDAVGLRLNGVTASNYARHFLYGTGASAAASGAANQTRIYLGGASGNTATASIFGAVVLDILDYASSTKATTARAFSGHELNSADGEVFIASGLWTGTDAVSTVTLLPWDGANFAQHSTAALYGIKAP